MTDEETLDLVKQLREARRAHREALKLLQQPHSYSAELDKEYDFTSDRLCDLRDKLELGE